MNSEQDTLPNLQTILNAINNLREETSKQINDLREDTSKQINDLRQEMTANFNRVDARFEDMRLQMMSFDVRIDRLEASSHELLNIAYNTRADVKVLREEVHSWSKEVSDLREKV